MNIKILRKPLWFVALAAASPLAMADVVWLEPAAATWAHGEVVAATPLPAQGKAVSEAEFDTQQNMRILASPPEFAFRLSAGNSSFSSALPDIGLWRFINSVRAQQAGTTLVLLESNLRILEVNSTPAPVPLPGAAWFMVMGLLGLVGVKATGRGERAPARGSLAPLGAAT